MNGHTPGPWVESDGGWIEGPDGKDVCRYEGCGTHSAEWPNPADKVLALAAPELLEALRPMVEGTAWLTEAHVAAARAAIAKATGEAA